MIIKEIEVNRYIAKSKIEGIDFVINPYIGCPNGCIYCYASFIKKLTNHKEKWGTFLDVKKTNYKLKKISVNNKTYLLSSTTDCYNKYEEKYQLTKKILKELIKFDFKLIIETKNKLILRDLDILKQFKNLQVIISLNTLNDSLRKEIENDSSIEDRIKTIQKLSLEGIYTILNISPIMPYLTDYQEIILKTKDFVKEYRFEFLQLKGDYQKEFLKYIKEKHSNYYFQYAKIYLFKENNYFINLKQEIEKFCYDNKIKYKFTLKNC